MILIRIIGAAASITGLLVAVAASRHPSGAGRALTGGAVTAYLFAAFMVIADADIDMALAILAAATVILLGAITLIRIRVQVRARGTFAAYRADDCAIADQRRWPRPPRH